MAKASAQMFPPLLVVSGDQGLLRRRFIDRMKREQRKEGWSIINVDGSVPGAVRDALNGGGLLLTGHTLAVVQKPEAVDLGLLERHSQSTDYVTTLLLHIEKGMDGRKKFSKFIKGLGDGVHKAFLKPNEWKAPKAAVEFIQNELKASGMEISTALAFQVVKRAGSDFGVLSFEIDKMTLLAQASGITKIDVEQVRGALAPIAEAEVASIVEALAKRDRAKLSMALARLHKTSKKNPVMRLCGLLGSTVLKWTLAAHLDALPPREAAAELKLNPWYFETQILPAAKRWGKTGTIRLLRDMAASERAVLNGAQNPWVVLVSRLLAAC